MCGDLFIGQFGVEGLSVCGDLFTGQFGVEGLSVCGHLFTGQSGVEGLSVWTSLHRSVLGRGFVCVRSLHTSVLTLLRRSV